MMRATLACLLMTGVLTPAVGPESRLMVDAGGSDAHWTNGYKWALNTSKMLAEYDVHWFEEALNPDALEDYVKLREHSPVPISGGEVLTRRQAFQPWIEARVRHHPARRHRGRRHQRGALSPGRRRNTASASSRTAGTPRSASPLTCTSPPRSPAPTWSSI